MRELDFVVNKFGIVIDIRLEEDREKIKNLRLIKCKYFEVFMIIMIGKLFFI